MKQRSDVISTHTEIIRRTFVKKTPCKAIGNCDMYSNYDIWVHIQDPNSILGWSGHCSTWHYSKYMKMAVTLNHVCVYVYFLIQAQRYETKTCIKLP